MWGAKYELFGGGGTSLTPGSLAGRLRDKHKDVGSTCVLCCKRPCRRAGQAQGVRSSPRAEQTVSDGVGVAFAAGARSDLSEDAEFSEVIAGLSISLSARPSADTARLAVDLRHAANAAAARGVEHELLKVLELVGLGVCGSLGATGTILSGRGASHLDRSRDLAHCRGGGGRMQDGEVAWGYACSRCGAAVEAGSAVRRFSATVCSADVAFDLGHAPSWRARVNSTPVASPGGHSSGGQRRGTRASRSTPAPQIAFDPWNAPPWRGDESGWRGSQSQRSTSRGART